jgi:hypothetical protein
MLASVAISQTNQIEGGAREYKQPIDVLQTAEFNLPDQAIVFNQPNAARCASAHAD